MIMLSGKWHCNGTIADFLSAACPLQPPIRSTTLGLCTNGSLLPLPVQESSRAASGFQAAETKRAGFTVEVLTHGRLKTRVRR
jgi:hypothetical protein